MMITDSDRLRIIQEFEVRPWLWDHRLTSGSMNYDLRKSSLEEIAEMLSDEAREFTVDMVRTTWKNLRDQYIRRARIQREKFANGVNSDDLHKWRFYKNLQYLETEVAYNQKNPNHRVLQTHCMTPNENMELAESNTIDDEDDVFLSNGNEPDDDVNDGINDATPRIPSRQPVPIFTLDRNNRIVPIYQKTWAKSEPAIKIEYVQQDRRRELKRINHLPQHRRSLQPLPSASRPRTSELHSMTATVPRMEAFAQMVSETYGRMRDMGMDQLAHQFKRKIVNEVQHYEEIMQNALDANPNTFDALDSRSSAGIGRGSLSYDDYIEDYKDFSK